MTGFNELFDGHPGYFLHHGPGQLITGVDKQTGLPTYINGDVSYAQDDIRQMGFLEGTNGFIKEHGLPWNSRLNFINELADIESYFKKRSLSEPAILMKLGKILYVGPEPGLAMQLIQVGPSQDNFSDLHIRLISDHLHAGELKGIIGIWTTKDVDPALLEKREGTPKGPCLRPGTIDLSLRFYDSAKQISFFWGPVGSGLCFFRFDGVLDCFRRTQPATYYAALDLNLADWIPPYVQGLSKDPWRARGETRLTPFY